MHKERGGEQHGTFNFANGHFASTLRKSLFCSSKMPPSQLKRLKASLREQGINAPEKAKKHTKKSHEENSSPRAQRNAALSRIQESFNPFEFKTLARPKKFNITVNRSATPKGMVGRPGVTKSLGEETVRFPILCGLDTMANNTIS